MLARERKRVSCVGRNGQIHIQLVAENRVRNNEPPKETESFRGRGCGRVRGAERTMCRVEPLFPREPPWELADDKDTAGVVDGYVTFED